MIQMLSPEYCTLTDGADGDYLAPRVCSYPAPGMKTYDEDGELLSGPSSQDFHGSGEGTAFISGKVKPIFKKDLQSELLASVQLYWYMGGRRGCGW